MSTINKLEKKFGRYAIRNLSLYIVICFVASYLLQNAAEDIYLKLVFSPYHIFVEHQVWRLFTWILTTPDEFTVFTLIMMFFYYSIGNSIERSIGSFMYNLYIFGSLFLTTIGATVVGAVQYFSYREEIDACSKLINSNDPSEIINFTGDFSAERFEKAADFVADTYVNGAYMTYFLLIGLFLGFALVHSDAIVLLYFLIPFKVSWLAIFDMVMLAIQFIGTNNPYIRVNIVTYLLAFGIMYLIIRKNTSRHGFAYTRATSSMKRRPAPEPKDKSQIGQVVNMPTSISKHKCAICGRSEKDDIELEFRFCSKCNGNYEYCKDHLYNHEHVK